MRHQRLTIFIAIGILLLILVPLQTVRSQNYYEYTVEVRNDGSAFWIITQFSSINTATDSWSSFQSRIFDLVNAASDVTHREMEIDENSIQIDTTIALESQTTAYSFLWRNFSIISGQQLSFGDVFAVADFFGVLYGDAALQLSYPVEFQVLAVNPPPYERQDSAQTMKWSRTQDLTSNSVSIVLTSSPVDQADASIRLFSLIAIVALAIAIPIGGFYHLKRNRKQTANLAPKPPIENLLETEEDKVIKILKAAGGSLRQSEITERCKFSKAKTSQLLTSLEKKGNLTRYKKGRDKIVILKETGKGER